MTSISLINWELLIGWSWGELRLGKLEDFGRQGKFFGRVVLVSDKNIYSTS